MMYKIKKLERKAAAINLKNTVKGMVENEKEFLKHGIAKPIIAEILVKKGLDLFIDNDILTSLIAVGTGYLMIYGYAKEALGQPKDELKTKRLTKKYTAKKEEEIKNLKEFKELAAAMNVSEEALLNMIKNNAI